MNIEILPYSEDLRSNWDNVVNGSYNGSFMHTRNFIDYHGDKFIDKSLIININNKPCAIFPAAINRYNELISHPGLSVGGLIYNDQVRGNVALEILEAISNYYNTKIIYKAIPQEFHRLPVKDDIWALNVLGNSCFDYELSSVVSPHLYNYTYWPNRKNELQNLQNNVNLSAMPLYDLNFINEFWKTITIPNLEKHNVVPTHTPEDIHYLFTKFPVFIKGLLATHHSTGKMLGGLIIFRYNKCYHVQYSVASGKGRALSVISLMHHYMIENLPGEIQHYSFGKSTENNGSTINQSLYDYKNSFGGGSIVYEIYEY